MSCLCSRPEECEITGDNKLEVVNGLTEVTIFVKYFIKNILIYLYFVRSISARRRVLRMTTVDITIGKKYEQNTFIA